MSLPDTGRKFWISLLGMVLVVVRPEASEAIAAIVLAFCSGNAVIEWRHAGSSMSSTHKSTSENRDYQIGFEPTP